MTIRSTSERSGSKSEPRGGSKHVEPTNVKPLPEFGDVRSSDLDQVQHGSIVRLIAPHFKPILTFRRTTEQALIGPALLEWY